MHGRIHVTAKGVDGMNLVHSEREREPLSREQRRSRRKRVIRARTISIKRMSRYQPARDDWSEEIAPDRPATRADCVDGPRPCPHVWCKYHLYLDVSPRTGAIKLNFPDLEVWELGASCALDIADTGGSTLEDVGALMNLTRERIRQLELRAMARLASVRDMHALREHVPEAAEKFR
jgi:Sigma-70, region 4